MSGKNDFEYNDKSTRKIIKQSTSLQFSSFLRVSKFIDNDNICCTYVVQSMLYLTIGSWVRDFYVVIVDEGELSLHRNREPRAI